MVYRDNAKKDNDLGGSPMTLETQMGDLRLSKWHCLHEFTRFAMVQISINSWLNMSSAAWGPQKFAEIYENDIKVLRVSHNFQDYCNSNYQPWL